MRLRSTVSISMSVVTLTWDLTWLGRMASNCLIKRFRTLKGSHRTHHTTSDIFPQLQELLYNIHGNPLGSGVMEKDSKGQTQYQSVWILWWLVVFKQWRVLIFFKKTKQYMTKICWPVGGKPTPSRNSVLEQSLKGWHDGCGQLVSCFALFGNIIFQSVVVQQPFRICFVLLCIMLKRKNKILVDHPFHHPDQASTTGNAAFVLVRFNCNCI